MDAAMCQHLTAWKALKLNSYSTSTGNVRDRGRNKKRQINGKLTTICSDNYQKIAWMIKCYLAANFKFQKNQSTIK